jgi:hypothetical protein
MGRRGGGGDLQPLLCGFDKSCLFPLCKKDKRKEEEKWREIERRGREREKEEAARDKLSRLQKKGIKAWETYGIFRLFCIF